MSKYSKLPRIHQVWQIFPCFCKRGPRKKSCNFDKTGESGENLLNKVIIIIIIIIIKRRVSSHIQTPRSYISKMRWSVPSDIQTVRSDISNTTKIVSSDIQTVRSDISERFI